MKREERIAANSLRFGTQVSVRVCAPAAGTTWELCDLEKINAFIFIMEILKPFSAQGFYEYYIRFKEYLEL